MQTNPAVEQSKIIRWSKSPWNQSGKKKRSVEERICWRAKSWVQNEILSELKVKDINIIIAR